MTEKPSSRKKAYKNLKKKTDKQSKQVKVIVLCCLKVKLFKKSYFRFKNLTSFL